MYIKTEKTFVKIGDIEIKKRKFHQHKRPISIKNININKIVVCNKVLFHKIWFRYFNGYKDAKKFWSFCGFLPKMSAYRRDFDKTNYMYFLIKDDKLLQKHSEIWKKLK